MSQRALAFQYRSVFIEAFLAQTQRMFILVTG